MWEKRVGSLYIWDRLLKEIQFSSMVNTLLGKQTWAGWSYGELAQLLIYYYLILEDDEQITFSCFLEEYAALELLEKNHWDLPRESEPIEALFKKYWINIFHQVSMALLQKQDLLQNNREWVMLNTEWSVQLSGDWGFPVRWVSSKDMDHVEFEAVYRIERHTSPQQTELSQLSPPPRLKKAFDHPIPLIALLPSTKREWQEHIDSQSHDPDKTKIGNHSISYSAIIEGNLRYLLVHKIKQQEIPKGLELQLQHLQTKAWEKGYDEGILWLNRELKSVFPSFQGYPQKLRIWTTRVRGYAMLHWCLKEPYLHEKEIFMKIVTNLSENQSNEWILNVLQTRETWIDQVQNYWIKRCKQVIKNNKQPQPWRLGIISLQWILEHHLQLKRQTIDWTKNVWDAEAIARIKWRDDGIRIPHEVNRWIHRLFPEEEAKQDLSTGLGI